jgi:hypothetical protein
MKTVMISLSFATLLALVGCNSNSSGSSPNPKNPPDKPSETKFSVNNVTGPTLKQGEAKTIKVTLSRQKDFSDDVKITFDDNKKGLVFDPAASEIKGSDKEADVKINAKDDAELGEHTVTLHATPSKAGAQAAKQEFQVKVEKK